jgi:hypothetical protein
VKGTETRFPIREKERVMAQFRSQNASPGYDPAPNVATPAEIRLAEELRRRLEELYLSDSNQNPALSHAFPENVH